MPVVLLPLEQPIITHAMMTDVTKRSPHRCAARAGEAEEAEEADQADQADQTVGSDLCDTLRRTLSRTSAVAGDESSTPARV